MPLTMASSIHHSVRNQSPTYEMDSKDLRDRMLAAEVLADFASMGQKAPMGISRKETVNSPQYHVICHNNTVGSGNKNDKQTGNVTVPNQNRSKNAISLDHSGMAKSITDEPITVKKIARPKTCAKQVKRAQRRSMAADSESIHTSSSSGPSSNEFVDVKESSENMFPKEMKNARNTYISLSKIQKYTSPVIIKAEYLPTSSSMATVSIPVANTDTPSDISKHSRLCSANATQSNKVQKYCALPLKKRKFVASEDLTSKSADPSSSTTSSSSSQSIEKIVSDRKSTDSGTVGVGVVPAVRTMLPQDSASMVPDIDATKVGTSSDTQQFDIKTLPITKEEGSALSYHVDPQKSLLMLKEIHMAQRQDEDGDLPLHIAVIHENLLMVKRLVHLLQIAGKSVDKYNMAQQTPLHLAIKVNFTRAVKALLVAGADVNLVDRLGHNAVHLCVKHQLPKSLAIVLKHSKHPDLNKRDFEGLTPLHTAVTLKNALILQTLLNSGADPDVVDGKSGRTALFHAAESESSHMLELLIQGHANVEVANYAGITAIVAANARGSSATVKQLLRNGADPAGMILVEDNFTEMQMKKVQVQKFPTVRRPETIPGRRFLTQKIKSAVNAFVHTKAAKQQQDVPAENYD